MAESKGWDGDFILTVQRNIQSCLSEFEQLDAYLRTEAYREAPMYVRIAIDVAWVQAKRFLASARENLAFYCDGWFDDSAFPKIDFTWHSTPALWGATRPDYDGAPDANCPQGFGKTKEEAAADLIENEISMEETRAYRAARTDMEDKA